MNTFNHGQMIQTVTLVGLGAFNGLLTWLEKILNDLHNIPMSEGSIISTALIFAHFTMGL